VTTRHAQAIYPFTSGGGLGGRGTFIGRDTDAGAFCFDPWVLYDDGALDDPNAIVIGKLGQGKSALVKTLLWRMLLFGRRAFVLDVKSEYGPLCASVGVRPVSLSPGGAVRLNPLSARPEEHAQIDLLRAIATTAIGLPLDQLEAAALREALRTVRGRVAEPTLPQISEVMFDPPADMASRLQTTPARLASDCRRAALALQDLCEGPLKGIFDGPTSPGIDLDARLLVLDLHAVRDSPAVGILMACATAWMSAQLARTADPASSARGRLINVADESWKVSLSIHGRRHSRSNRSRSSMRLRSLRSSSIAQRRASEPRRWARISSASSRYCCSSSVDSNRRSAPSSGHSPVGITGLAGSGRPRDPPRAYGAA
jgi:type IV secretory pathway VirB4 component